MACRDLLINNIFLISGLTMVELSFSSSSSLDSSLNGSNLFYLLDGKGFSIGTISLKMAKTMILKIFLSFQPLRRLTSDSLALIKSFDLSGWGFTFNMNGGAFSKGGVKGLSTLMLLLNFDS